MKIAITTSQVPFIRGGAELMTEGLLHNLRARGHQVEIISIPFIFHNKKHIKNSMDYWERQNFNGFDVGEVDMVICLKFPTYYLKHHNKVVWLMHQHRSVYELWDTNYGDVSSDKEACLLREDIMRRDTKHINESTRIFTISKTVGSRLKKYNNIDSQHIYQPSPISDLLGPGEQHPYIFCPSRLEDIKRQELLIRAVSHCKTDCNILISGEGGIKGKLQELIEKFNLNHRVELLGHVSQSELASLYRNALAVYFAPIGEDYGFVTLEAMQSAKPIITCSDSGGPLEFVLDGKTGFVVDPDAKIVAGKIDFLFSNKKVAKEMGLNAYEHYKNLNINWGNVVDQLIEGGHDCPNKDGDINI